MTFLELFNADVNITRDIPYLAEGASGGKRHRLDVYAPPAADGLPVVVFFYGGGWRSGDKRLFEHLGRAYAVRGMVCVTVNYRLTPSVVHPHHAEDCSAAVAWVVRTIAEYGGDPSLIFLSGHSAGAHLAALLSVDEHFLTEQNLPAGVIQGTIMISGVGDLREHAQTTRFTSRQQIEEAFGDTADELAAASPITYVKSGLRPFLVIVAEDDPDGLRQQGRMIVDALRKAGNDAMYISVKGRDHFSIVRRFGADDDTTVDAIVQFVQHVSRRASVG